MKNKKLLHKIVGMGMVISLLLTGCGSGSSAVGGDGSTQQTGADTKTEAEAEGTGQSSENAGEVQTSEASDGKQTEDAEDSLPTTEESIADALTQNGMGEQTELKDMGDIFLSLSTNYDYINSKDEKVYFSYASVETEVPVVQTEGLDALELAFQKNGKERLEGRQWFVDAAAEYGPEAQAETEGYSLDWSYEDKINVVRNDGKVVSFWSTVYSYLGGVHPDYNSTGYSYVAETGEMLELSDVVTDLDRFAEVIIEQLTPESEEFWEDWKDTIKQQVYSSEEVSPLSWVVGNDGIEVIFNTYMLSYYAAGSFSASVSYADYPDLFRINLSTQPSDLFCIRVYPYNEFSYDFDQDGSQEYLMVSTEENSEYGYVTVTVQTGTESGTYNGSAQAEFLELDSLYIMNNREGKIFLYVMFDAESDMSGIEIYDLSNPKKGPVDVGYNNTGYIMSPFTTNPETIYCADRGWIMGTWTLMSECQIGADGQLESKMDYYRIYAMDWDAPFTPGAKLSGPGSDSFSMRALRDFTADLYEDFNSWESWNGTTGTVAEGTVLYPYATDGKNYVLFMTEEGSFVQVSYSGYDEENWTALIDGKSEYDTLADIIYAG